MVRHLLAWWRRRGLRSRVTLTAAAGLLVAFAVADVLLVFSIRTTVTRSADHSARQAAEQVVALIDSQPLPDPVPVAAGTVTIQVLAPDGRIIDVSADADRLVPLLSPAAAAESARAGTGTQISGGPYGLPPLLRVDAASAANGDVVIAAVPYDTAGESLSVVERALEFGTPLLFLLFTGAIWLAVGSTLRPITLLRRGAATVSATGVPRALPVPAARDEVRSLALTLNGMLSRLALARQRQRDLVSDTAHELRSPIASMRTQLEVALDHPGLQDWAETARDVHADVLRLARLAEDLLVLARLDERADLGDALDDTAGDTADDTGDDTGDDTAGGAQAVADLADLSGCVVGRYTGARVPVVHIARAPCPVRGDAAALDRVLVNLIDNALRYAKSQVTVTAGRVTDPNGWAELTVTDDGPGIPAADLERAFGRFTRLDLARSRDGEADGGAGLGLAIVRATAQAFGGTAHLEPAPPPPSASQPAGASQPGDGSPGSQPGGGSAGSQPGDGSAGLRAVVRLPLAP